MACALAWAGSLAQVCVACALAWVDSLAKLACGLALVGKKGDGSLVEQVCVLGGTHWVGRLRTEREELQDMHLGLTLA